MASELEAGELESPLPEDAVRPAGDQASSPRRVFVDDPEIADVTIGLADFAYELAAGRDLDRELIEARTIEKIKERYWQLRDEYHEQPRGAWNLKVGTRPLHIYDFSHLGSRFSRYQAAGVANAFAVYQQTFPDLPPTIDTVTVTDRLPRTSFAYPFQFKEYGRASRTARLLELSPEGASVEPYLYGQYGVPIVSMEVVRNLALTHMPYFESAWRQAGYGEILEQGRLFAVIHFNRPETSINAVGRISIFDDIAESVAAFVYEEKLAETGVRLPADKRAILTEVQGGRRASLPIVQVARGKPLTVPPPPEEIKLYHDPAVPLAA